MKMHPLYSGQDGEIYTLSDNNLHSEGREEGRGCEPDSRGLQHN